MAVDMCEMRARRTGTCCGWHWRPLSIKGISQRKNSRASWEEDEDVVSMDSLQN